MQVDVCGPLFYHVFLWLGGGVSEFAMHSAYQHCQSLLQCLPGQPQLHREVSIGRERGWGGGGRKGKGEGWRKGGRERKKGEREKVKLGGRERKG